jgi:hypothetical protein
MAPRKVPTVGDPTDPRGTLRPNLPPETGTGDHYVPLNCPDFSPTINLPPGVDKGDPIAIWDLFFSSNILENIVKHTNKKGISLQKPDEVWKDLDLPELYAYLAILFYMGLHIENDRRLYWSQNPNGPLHQPVISAMSRDRWLNIDRAWSISDPLAKYETVFDKVSFLFDFICNLLTN